MTRSQVRFDGLSVVELPTPWAQAQKDALGYFVWLYCRLAHAERTTRVLPDGELLALFARYFKTIRYWEDEDSGHWEERRKTEASSIGAVVAGLRELRMILAQRVFPVPDFGGEAITMDFLDELIETGVTALRDILLSESSQPAPRKNRRYDAA